MDQEPHIRRALVLHERGRYGMAADELRRHLAANPGDGFAWALLASSLLGLDHRDDAEDAARHATGLAPNLGFTHFTLGRVLAVRNRDDEALAAAKESLRLEPDNAEHHALRAAIEYDRHRWAAALAAAEAGLECDAEHLGCSNIRAMTLVKLGRGGEAADTMRSTLARNPESALSHANRGWALLTARNRRGALEHFRESLRLDPTDHWAQAGLVEAIKAGNPLYRIVLGFALVIQKLGGCVQWGILFGWYFVGLGLGAAEKAHPAWGPWVGVILALYGGFAVLTLLADPVFNLLLAAHPLGRHALSHDQRLQAACVAGCLGSATCLCVAWRLSGGWPPLLLGAFAWGLLAIPVAEIFACQPGWPRRTMTMAVGGLGGLAILATLELAWRQPGSDPTAADLHFRVFIIGTVLCVLLANDLARHRPAR